MTIAETKYQRGQSLLCTHEVSTISTLNRKFETQALMKKRALKYAAIDGKLLTQQRSAMQATT